MLILRIFHRKKYFEGMLYVPTTNVQGFIYYFGIFYLKIGKFYTFFQLGKGQVMGPKISAGKSLILNGEVFLMLMGYGKLGSSLYNECCANNMSDLSMCLAISSRQYFKTYII